MASTISTPEPKGELAQPEATVDHGEATKLKEKQAHSENPPARTFHYELSYDLQYKVLRSLDYSTATLLTSTNRYFHNVLYPKLEYAIPVPERLEGCKKVDQNTRSSQRAHAQTLHKSRRCWTCAIENNYYADLRPVKKDRVLYYPCHDCGLLGTEFNRCRGEHVSRNVVNRQCSKDKQLSPFERFSTGILRQTIGYLDCLDTIHLHMASCSTMHQVKLDWVAIHKRFALVLTKEAPLIELVYPEIFKLKDESASPVAREMPRQEHPYPCYSCFKVKTAAKFSSKTLQFAQEEPNRFWQRRCKDCCTLAADDQGILTLWLRHRLCSDCGLVRVRGEACLGCSEA
ncbi:hypothetical protein BDP81DRAFT_451311 [Colletotrichum phormii]|uniref:F-box domain-containing protein n=1 Tax=Colletotrichum phormii TaxID=359342 RepID=A0AAJ0EFB5_9PEZI|nr:uncharacterized protein BDP81DRAFT_451311 [Colletotrichum phormii]KAK1634810.1 hypothetical protein BDP81DRAFT_451311 [Colletotrichum phormii]